MSFWYSSFLCNRLIFSYHGRKKKTMKHGAHIGTKRGQRLMTAGRCVDYTSDEPWVRPGAWLL
jgi:hypothetical protein